MAPNTTSGFGFNFSIRFCVLELVENDRSIYWVRWEIFVTFGGLGGTFQRYCTRLTWLFFTGPKSLDVKNQGHFQFSSTRGHRT